MLGTALVLGGKSLSASSDPAGSRRFSARPLLGFSPSKAAMFVCASFNCCSQFSSEELK